MKITKEKLLLGAVLAVAFTVFLNVFMIYRDARNIGKTIGEIPGAMVGRGIGAVEGYLDGKEHGKEDALAAPEASADIVGRVHSIGVLEVLEVDVNSSDVMKIGDEENPNFAELVVMSGNAVFTVDLSKCVVDINNDTNEMTVHLPAVEADYEVDEKSKNTVAVYQRTGWTGSSSDGITAKINAEKEITLKIREQLRRDETLRTLAENSAESQVKTLAQVLTGGRYNVVVVFDGED